MINKCGVCGAEFYCNPARYARGGGRYCSPKCKGLYRRGIPVFRKTKTVEELLWPRVNKTESCWLWTGPKQNGGYGIFSLNTGRYQSTNMLVHRVSWELSNGKIPEGLCIDHLCRVRHCVNPSHMEIVSLKVNVLRGIGLSAENSKKTECKNGHLFSPENTYLANGKYGIQRQCRKCKVICKKERN